MGPLLVGGIQVVLVVDSLNGKPTSWCNEPSGHKRKVKLTGTGRTNLVVLLKGS